jgi:Domain of unknown function (DUF4123)/FHA domain
MHIVLEIVLGPFAGKKLELWEGQSIRVGRTTRADFVIPHDHFMSSLHFSVSLQTETCVLRDLGSVNGTFLNRNRIQEAMLKQGDMVLAGETSFSVSVQAVTDLAQTRGLRTGVAPASTASLFSRTLVMKLGAPQTVRVTKPDLLRLLTERPEPLFGLLDASRDSRVLDFLRASEDMWQSLYQGAKGEELACVAPYLVHLPKTSALLPKLIDASWGQSWGVYLTSSQSFSEIRKHLRRFLTVSAADGRKLFFRFYDPRVLRVYIPTCTTDERNALFGPVSCFLMEDDEPDQLLLFHAFEE